LSDAGLTDPSGVGSPFSIFTIDPESMMRAILVASSATDTPSPPCDRYPTPLLWLYDRPLVQHVIEGLEKQRVREIDWVHAEWSDPLVRFLGDGSRWGLVFRHHTARGSSVYAVALTLTQAAQSDGPVILGHADRLIEFPAGVADSDEQVLFGTRTTHDSEQATIDWVWSGWAVLTNQNPRDPRDFVEDEEACVNSLLSGDLPAHWRDVPQLADVRTLLTYQIASRKFLDNSLAAESGLQIAASARVHPTARLIPPVSVGRDVEIGANAIVGPFTVVGTDCVIDHAARVADSVVLPGTYIGDSLHLSRVVIDRERVLYPGMDGETVEWTGAATGNLADCNPVRVAASALALARNWGRSLLRAIRLLTSGPASRTAGLPARNPAVIWSARATLPRFTGELKHSRAEQPVYQPE
jgi:NDP-sugar pyrophosphorylase family protein